MKTTAFLALFVTGCFWVTTKSEGEGLRKDVNSLNDRISTKERALDDQVKQLQTVIDEATKVLKRNNADIGADVEALRADVRTANGLVTSINQGINDIKTAFDKYKKDNDARMDALEARTAQIESGKPSANSSPTDLWRLGSAAFDASRFNDAIEIFKRLVATYPTDGKADDAQYFKGQSYGKLLDWEHAIAAYQTLVEKYPDSELADDGTLLRRTRRAADKELHRSADLPRAREDEVSEVERAVDFGHARRADQEGPEEQVQVLELTTCRRASCTDRGRRP